MARLFRSIAIVALASAIVAIDGVAARTAAHNNNKHTADDSASASSGSWQGCESHFIGDFRPAEHSNAVRLCRNGYIAMSFDKDLTNPAWSQIFITPDQVNKVVSNKRPGFYRDPDLKKLGVAQPKPTGPNEYSPYDKGHLTPNSIMSWSQESQYATFTCANIAPQNAGFNEGAWMQLEHKLQTWVGSNVEVYILTGVIFTNRNVNKVAKTPKGNVPIPSYYFKIVCDLTNQQSAGFLGENRNMGDVREASEIREAKKEAFGTTTFHTVEFIEKLYGGQLFPKDACQTDAVDPTHWWGEEGDAADQGHDEI